MGVRAPHTASPQVRIDGPAVAQGGFRRVSGLCDAGRTGAGMARAQERDEYSDPVDAQVAIIRRSRFPDRALLPSIGAALVIWPRRLGDSRTATCQRSRWTYPFRLNSERAWHR